MNDKGKLDFLEIKIKLRQHEGVLDRFDLEFNESECSGFSDQKIVELYEKIVNAACDELKNRLDYYDAPSGFSGLSRIADIMRHEEGIYT